MYVSNKFRKFWGDTNTHTPQTHTHIYIYNIYILYIYIYSRHPNIHVRLFVYSRKTRWLSLVSFKPLESCKGKPNGRHNSPKTNMEPENTPLEKEKHRPKPPVFGFKMLVCGAYLAKLLQVSDFTISEPHMFLQKSRSPHYENQISIVNHT